MFTKYRIKQYGYIFYPQHTSLYFFWNNYYRNVCYDGVEQIKFNTYEEANDFICKNKEIIHRVKCNKGK